MTAKGSELEKNIFQECFSTLEDSRRTSMGNLKHPIGQLLFLTLSSISN